MSGDVSCFSYNVKGGKAWGYRFEIAAEGGTRKWETKRGFPTKTEAAKAGREAKSQYDHRGTVIVSSQISYSDFLDIWLDSLIGQVKETTLFNYKKRIGYYIRPYLGKYRLDSIKRADVRKVLKTLYEKGIAINTLVVVKGLLTSSFAFAVEEHFLLESPALGNIPIPKEETFGDDKIATASKPHVYIPREKIEQIFERFPVGSSTHIALMLGYKCGLRLGEVFALTWEDVDFEKSKITVSNQVQWHSYSRPAEQKKDPRKRGTSQESGFWYFSPPKYNSVREIGIDSELLALLKKEKEQQENDREYYAEHYCKYYRGTRGQVLTERNGDLPEIRFVNVRRDGSYITPRALLHTSKVIHTALHFSEFDFHSLRHTHATMLVEKGASPMYVQHRLGHKNINVTIKTYFHYTEEFDRAGNLVLEEMYSMKGEQ